MTDKTAAGPREKTRTATGQSIRLHRALKSNRPDSALFQVRIGFTISP